MKVWFNGKLLDERRACISLLTHALHYGTAAFEGIRFYKTIEGIAIFKLEDHLKRLLYSASTIQIKSPWSLKTIQRAIIQTIQINKLQEGYIRPILFYGKGALGVNPKKSKLNLAIVALPWGKYLKKDIIKLKTVHIQRFSKLAFNPRAKIAGPYVNSVMANQEAKKAGYDEALMLDQKGCVSECSGENIFIVKNKIIYTPLAENILPGITRSCIFNIAKDLRLKTKEKNIKIKDIYEADECFMTGTAAEITPVGQLDNRIINKNKVGEITFALQTIFRAITRGKTKKFQKWLTYI